MKPGLANRVRIIGGELRGRRLTFPNLPGLRPTPDRVRETLFNWLAPVIGGARCLDLFAGSGALGFEALSRGAATAWLVEAARPAAQRLQEHVRELGLADRCRVVQQDALRWLHQAPPMPFDLVFLDPPFRQDLLPEVLGLLLRDEWLTPTAWIYLEQASDGAWPDLPGWQVWREGVAGDSAYRLMRRASIDSP